MSGESTTGLDRLQAALDQGDLDGARRVLLTLDQHEQHLLAEEMGRDAFERARGAAARGRRRGKLGKVIVLPGIMGSELDAVDGTGAADRIWLSFTRLIQGRIEDLELAPDGSPAKPGLHVRAAGLHRKTYIPLLMELDTRWHVRPFAFDWREDIDKSAARLEGEVKAFGAGDPVHLVAHSMGGLVSRRFIQRYRDTWRSMDDPSGSGRGGRLVMLGTPNRGSFAIPLTLTGVEKAVRMLARADLRHDRNTILSIIGSFPGAYQMLPSAAVELGDDHLGLFDPESWGAVPVETPLLTRGKTFLVELDEVIDPERLIYVAGANQETPFEIRIDAPGRFAYRQTLDGDGRVAHRLGLLDGVTTYWVEEIHGNLPKNGGVLDAMTELLQRGATTALPKTKPPPTPTRRARRGWVDGDQLEPVPPAINTILAGARSRGTGDEPGLTPADAARLENLALREYLGSGEDEQAGKATEPEQKWGVEVELKTQPIGVEIVWGDVANVDADVFTVGHYQGVLPQRAELALDKVVSGIDPADEEYDRRRLVITQQARQGILRGALGDVLFFPWGDAEHAKRLIAVAGMGRPGTFSVAGLRTLIRGLVIAVSALPRHSVICTVLIGSGEGTLSLSEAVRGLLQGIGDAASEIAAREELIMAAPVEKLIIAELDQGRAQEILDEVRRQVDELQRNVAVEEGSRPHTFHLAVERRLKRAPGGTVSVEEGVALLADSAVKAARAEADSPEARALAALIDQAPGNRAVRRLLLDSLNQEAARVATGGRPRFRVARRADRELRSDVPVRIAFWEDGDTIRAAAITQAATVPERVVGVSRDVIDELAEKCTDPAADALGDLSDLLYRLVVPPEFREALGWGPVVFEVDRGTARIHWEMLAAGAREDGRGQPLAVSQQVARQLRTTYSPSPAPPHRRDEKRRALVIGDPGDPEKGHDLPGARSEALAVKNLLEEHGVDVDARIGAPSVPREGPLQGVKPAERLEILALILRGGFDLIHYAGHGDFDAAKPDRVGWLFATGLLTPGEIGRLERVPAIVVSNACLSARTSQALESGRRPDEARSEAGLLPSLADEFFKLGVRNYVGTAWEVNDVGAELFASTFYRGLLSGKPFGEAVLNAREELWKEESVFGALWAAYQHYGDPTSDAGLTGS